MSDEPMTEDPMIAALLRERVGLVQRGLKDRVAQVDEQLKLRGYKPAPRDKKPTGSAGQQDAGDGQGDGGDGQRAAKPQGRQQPASQQT